MKNMSSKDIAAVVVMIVLTVLLIGGFLLFNAFKEKSKLSEETLCPVLFDQETLHTFILIDKSDKWPAKHAKQVKSLLTRVYRDIPVGGRLTLLSIQGNSKQVIVGRPTTEVSTRFDMCNPGNEQQCSQLYQNCRRVEKRYQEAFQGPLQDLINELQVPGESAFSPIFESIMDIIDSSKTKNIQIHLISDLMENGHHFRFYDLIPAAGDISNVYAIPSGFNIKITAHTIERRRHSRVLMNAVENVWRNYFISQGMEFEYIRLLTSD